MKLRLTVLILCTLLPTMMPAQKSKRAHREDSHRQAAAAAPAAENESREKPERKIASAAPDEADTTACPQRAYTPAQMDSVISVLYARRAGESFEDFAREFVTDVPDAASTALPDSVYEHRLRALASAVPLPYNSIVKNYIARYTDTRWQTMGNIISLSQYYFPMIEEELVKAGLPVELRALPIIESALRVNAVSRAGAVGLWQFMPSTGKLYGLEINSMVDERCDPVLSTRAACRFLKDLYSMFGDWTLAIAAYNCGPGNVTKAFARAGHGARSFWDIYEYLPRETRGYVPAFIGASYAYAYHRQHGIKVERPPMPMATDTVTVSRITHLEQISSTIDLPLETLRDLNPQYKMNIIPATTKTYALTLPMRSLSEYVAHEAEIMSKDSLYLKEYINPANIDKKKLESIRTIYVVRSGDTLSRIASRHGCTVAQLKKWNNLRSDRINIGQRLRIERSR